MRKLILFLISTLLMVNATSIASASTVPTYSFVLEQYASMQNIETDYIDVSSYLPDSEMTLTYQLVMENLPEDLYEITTITYLDEYSGYAEYEHTSTLAGYDAYIYGAYYYDSETDCLVETTNDLGTISDDKYLLPMKKQLTKGDSMGLTNVPYLFTVDTPAGTFDDCVCVVRQERTDESIVVTARYYAKGIGLVLSVDNYSAVHNGADENDFEVGMILCELTKYDTFESDIECIADIARSQLLESKQIEDGSRYENIETESLLEVKTFTDATADVFYRLDMEDGRYFWTRHIDQEIYVDEYDDNKAQYPVEVYMIEGFDTDIGEMRYNTYLQTVEINIYTEQEYEYGDIRGTYYYRP